MTQYYRTDVLRLSWAEMWRIAPTFRVFLRGAIFRCLNLRSAPRWGIAHDAVRFIDPQTIPDDAVNRLKSVVDAGAPLGFRPSVWSTLDTIGPVAGYSVAMLDSSGAMYAGGAWVRLAFRTPPRGELAFSAVSKLADGRFIMTGSSRKRLDKPSGFQVLHLPGQGFCEIVKKHQEQLSDIRGEDIVRLDDVLVAGDHTGSHPPLSGFQYPAGPLVAAVRRASGRHSQQAAGRACAGAGHSPVAVAGRPNAGAGVQEKAAAASLGGVSRRRHREGFRPDACESPSAPPVPVGRGGATLGYG